nr:cell wall hydrolase [Geminicoccus roseus]
MRTVIAFTTGVLASSFLLSAAQAQETPVAEVKAETLEEKIADRPEPEPAAGPERITATEAEQVDPEGDKALDDPLTCLARTIYWEAKGQSSKEMTAVAAVVLNRLATPEFPKTVCGVVTQGQETGACQFSWWCDGKPDDVEEPTQYAEATEIARKALNQQLTDPTDGAVSFHLSSVHPGWTDRLVRTVQIGDQIFYRLPDAPAGG